MTTDIASFVNYLFTLQKIRKHQKSLHKASKGDRYGESKKKKKKKKKSLWVK
jgi:hypothetical protein